MTIPLRTLIIEDSEDDVILLTRALKLGGYDPDVLRVETPENMRTALLSETWDIIISDYSMPRFSGLAALSLMKELELEVPFIIVSGTIGEALAVEAMRAGAHDYLMKDNLARLIPAIERELHEAKIREERRQREQEIEAIATISTHLREAVTHKDMLEILQDQFQNLVSVEAVAFLLKDMQEDFLQVELASGRWENWQGHTIQMHEGVTGAVIQSQIIYVNPNLHDDQLFAHPELISGAQSAVCVPLITNEEAIGAFWVGRATQKFTDNEVRVLSAASNIAANALQRARILETLEQRVIERTAELQALNDRLTELDKLKSKFVSDVSHELRTPVTSLGVYLDLLKTGSIDKHDHYLDILQNQVIRLSNLVENILDLSRLEADLAKPMEPIQFNDVVQDVVQDLTPVAERRGLRFSYMLEPQLAPIEGNYDQLIEVITNLVGNAINYTMEGYIRVKTCAANARVEFVVEDTGLGIGRADLPHLFERFYRGQGVGQSAIPGTGLGLSIVREIVEQHNGSIRVESEEGVGSRFIVEFPAMVSG